MTAEQLAQLFHETYERLAPNFGYETRKESAVPWLDVPEKNKRLMIAVAEDILREQAKEGCIDPDERPTIVKWTRLDGSSDTFVSGNEHRIEERLHGLFLCHMNGKITDLTIEH